MGKTSSERRDVYYRLAKTSGWRARSAFKLLQINEHFKIFDGVTRVVDLCAAPGSWSQVLSAEVYARNKSNACVVAVDLQPMAALPGVIQIQGDITSQETAQKIIDNFDGELADLVVCDGAPDVTGLHAFDEFLQSQLIFAAFNISTFVLRKGGTFVSKIFLSSDGALMKSQMQLFFKTVHFFKPQSSRISSSESFIICFDYNPPDGYEPSLVNPVNLPNYEEARENFKGINRVLTPFMCCGDLSGFDSERTHPLDLSNIDQELREKFKLTDDRPQKEPIAPPTEPAYKKAVNLKRADLLEKPTTNKPESLIVESSSNGN